MLGSHLVNIFSIFKNFIETALQTVQQRTQIHSMFNPLLAGLHFCRKDFQMHLIFVIEEYFQKWDFLYCMNCCALKQFWNDKHKAKHVLIGYWFELNGKARKSSVGQVHRQKYGMIRGWEGAWQKFLFLNISLIVQIGSQYVAIRCEELLI